MSQSIGSEEFAQPVGELVVGMRLRGVRLWVENDALKYQAPQGLLTPSDIDQLRARKSAVIDFLRGSSKGTTLDSPLAPQASAQRVPFSFSQEWWWRSSEHFRSRRNVRSVTDATLVEGPLRITTLESSVNDVVARHATLRSRVTAVGDAHALEVTAAPPSILKVSGLPAGDPTQTEAEARRIVEATISDASDGRAFAATLIALAPDKHVFAIAVHHLACDQISLGLILRDIWTLYAERVAGLPKKLPELSIQYADYATWLRGNHEHWQSGHGRFWEEHLEGAQRVPFPFDRSIRSVLPGKVGHAPVGFPPALTTELRDLCRRANSMLPLGVLSSYVATVLRWQQRSDMVLTLVVSGRNRPELLDVVGFFAAPMHLRINLPAHHTFSDLLRSVTKEYYLAYDHYDAGRLLVADPPPAYSGCTMFNWVPWAEYLERPEVLILRETLGDTPNALQLKPFAHSRPVSAIDDGATIPDDDPVVLLAERNGGISGLIAYRADLLSAATMTGFSQNFLNFTEQMAKAPDSRVLSMTYAP